MKSKYEDAFWGTRLDAKVAYKKWKAAEKAGDLVLTSKALEEYTKAWEKYQEANVKLFIDECENEQ